MLASQPELKCNFNADSTFNVHTIKFKKTIVKIDTKLLLIRNMGSILEIKLEKSHTNAN